MGLLLDCGTELEKLLRHGLLSPPENVDKPKSA